VGEQTIKVFISYSWDSEQHRVDVLNLAKSLRQNGVLSVIDRYYETRPPSQGWYQWMKDERRCWMKV